MGRVFDKVEEELEDREIRRRYADRDFINK